jgi:hypothetical protein
VGGVDNKGWKKSHTSFTVDKLQLHVSSYSWNHPKVIPGSQIIVPENQRKRWVQENL